MKFRICGFIQFSPVLSLSYLPPKVSTCTSQKFLLRISNSRIAEADHDAEDRAQFQDVLREIAQSTSVIRPITRCLGMRQANSVVCVIIEGIVFIVMQLCSSYIVRLPFAAVHKETIFKDENLKGKKKKKINALV